VLAWAGIAGAAAADPAVREVVGGPALWRADAPGGGALFLLGSVHLGKDRIADFGPTIDAAWQRSDELVVEVDVSRIEPVEAARLTQRYGTLPEGRTVRDAVSRKTWSELSGFLESRGYTELGVERWKPWFLAFTLVQLELRRAGYQLELGVDRLFLQRAQGSKPIVGLETLDSQLGLFDGLPAAQQELMLRDVLLRRDRIAKETEELIETWLSGDEARLEKLVFSPLEQLPEMEDFYDVVFFRRNRRMVDTLDALSADGKTRFVVLGAGHLLGERGIPHRLGARGWQLRRVWQPPEVSAP
jgi:uncharacterized protein YbaP (TraB family)